MTEKIGIWTRNSYENKGIQTFESQTCPWLIENLEDAEKITYESLPEWIEKYIPLSRTFYTIFGDKISPREAEKYDKIFIPAQSRLNFDPRKLDAEFIVYVHDILPVTAMFKKYKDSSIKERLAGYPSKLGGVRFMKFLAYCDKIIAASEQTKQDLKQRTAFNGEIEVIHQGVDGMGEVERPDEKDIDLLYVGSLIERKNPEFIREAMQKAHDQGYKVVSVNFEETDLPGETFVDIPDEELAKVYSRTRYYLHPSFTEGFGRGAVEAQNYGAIPLALDRPINHEVLGQGWIEVETTEDVLEKLGEDIDTYTEMQAEKNADTFNWAYAREQLKEALTE